MLNLIYILLILIIVCFAIIVFIQKKAYDKTDYAKETHNSFWAVRADKGKTGEYFTYKYLSKLEGEKKFLFNCYLPKDNNTTEVDVILLHSSGVYVFESKNYSGWIFGSENKKTWTQTLENGKKNHFFNPIMQNKLHIKYLKLYLSQFENLSYHSIIVFSDRCKLKNIELTTKEHSVINRYDIYKLVKSISKEENKILSDETINQIYDYLYPLTQVTENEKLTHIENIKNKNNL